MDNEKENELNRCLLMMAQSILDLRERITKLEKKYETVDERAPQSRARDRQKAKSKQKV